MTGTGPKTASPLAQTAPRSAHARRERRRVGILITSNLLGGIGVASGIAVSAVLVEKLGSTSLAGLGQAAGVLGAAVAAVPLARLAARRGRRVSLSLGYAIAVLGAALVVTAATVAQVWLLIVGLCCFGVSQAVNLQSRYAATDGVPAAVRGRTMAVVIWATTLGSVAGPNLTGLGEAVGEAVHVPGLAGPYLFSATAFAGAGLAIGLWYRASTTAESAEAVGGNTEAVSGRFLTEAGGEAGSEAVEAGTGVRKDTGTADSAPVGALAALRWAAGSPTARFGVVLMAVAHATMVMVMVMTPLHMQHAGMSLEVVGVVISLHIVGMYALSPVFGRLTDAWGAVRTAVCGVCLFGLAVVLGFVSAATRAGSVVTACALVLLGLGWSASTISASTLLAATADERIRIPLQGAADAGMNYAGAGAAALAGPILAAGDFRAVNVAGAVLLLPVLILLAGMRAAARRPGPAPS